MLQSVFCLGMVVTNLHDRVHADVVSHSTTDRALRAKPLLDVVCAPKGGGKGGDVVAVGTPEQLAEVDSSHTGRFLSVTLDGSGSHRLKDAG